MTLLIKVSNYAQLNMTDFIIVTNIEKIKFSGKKILKKKYYRHTGHPGGIKTTTPSILFKNKP